LDLAQIVLVGPQDPLFKPVQVGLRAHGHETIRYKSEIEFLTSEERATRADILYAVSTLGVTRELMAESPKLRAVISPYTGTEGFDEKAATELGIVVGNGQPPENYESMAEATIMLMLAALYDLLGSEAHMRAGWITRRGQYAHMLKGKTVGLIGFGQISRAIAERLAPWRIQIQAFAPRVRQPWPDYVKPVGFEELLATSDILCVLPSLNADTRHMLNAQTLAMTKKGSILINTARGALIDEQALYDIAKTGHFSKIALDVYETEPLPVSSPLRSLPDTILTPHGIGHTQETMAILQSLGLENCLRVLKGEPPVYVRNPDVLPGWRRRWSAIA
jgi:phosphoglycerate dehydrogenase-like enzyme